MTLALFDEFIKMRQHIQASHHSLQRQKRIKAMQQLRLQRNLKCIAMYTPRVVACARSAFQRQERQYHSTLAQGTNVRLPALALRRMKTLVDMLQLQQSTNIPIPSFVPTKSTSSHRIPKVHFYMKKSTKSILSNRFNYK
ncbi:hypothetical protein THRCLA_21958 [Thraustotheca clavata]|uniref:Uncharacterized protein n=1 Tax=Thraustotheca clavata TaxID=74557 RepID=A0A1V9ZH34_9STRA|nr:hypothetical protein THRCLA_21958 [Thraustotheca clavata]